MTATRPSCPAVLLEMGLTTKLLEVALTFVEFLQHGRDHLVDFGESLFARHVGSHDETIVEIMYECSR